MAHIYNKLTSALQAHWKAHNKAYPKKFVISSAEHAVLSDARSSVRKAVTGKDVDDQFEFMGVKLEVDDSSPGVVVDKDGISHPLDQPA